MRVLITRVATAATAVALSAGFVVATTESASAAGCRLSYTTYSTVQVGRTGSKARSVECLLAKAGYAASQNSSFSSADAAKLKKFQAAHGLKQTGRTSGPTWAALIAQGSTPALEHGDRTASVQRLQLALRALGHDELPGTTLYGDKTQAAVKALQTAVGLTPTGKTDDAEWAALQAGGQAARTTGSSSGTSPGGSSTTSATSKGETALAFAKAQLGEKYKYGAAGPSSWDCSGLTMKAWAQAGVTLPHSAKAQYAIGTKVAQDDLRPGDLVFFYSGPSHVAIYAGDGLVVHAPRPGEKVGYIKLAYMPWKGARRPG